MIWTPTADAFISHTRPESDKLESRNVSGAVQGRWAPDLMCVWYEPVASAFPGWHLCVGTAVRCSSSVRCMLSRRFARPLNHISCDAGVGRRQKIDIAPPPSPPGAPGPRRPYRPAAWTRPRTSVGGTSPPPLEHLLPPPVVLIDLHGWKIPRFYRLFICLVLVFKGFLKVFLVFIFLHFGNVYSPWMVAYKNVK